MPDFNVTGHRNYTDINFSTISQTSGANKTNRKETLNDTIEIGTLRFEFVYKNDPNNPVIPTPINNLSSSPQTTTPPPLDPQNEYLRLFDEHLEDYAGQNNLSEENVDGIVTAFLNGAELEDKELQDILNRVVSDVEGQMEEAFPDLPLDYAPNIIREQFKTDVKENIQTTQNNKFEEKLNGFNVSALVKKLGISEAEAKKQILSGFYVGSDDPDIQAAISEINSAVISEIKSEFGLSADYEMPQIDNSSFLATVHTQLDENAEKQIDQYALDNKLTPEQKNQLCYAYYHPNENIPFASEAKGIFTQAQSAIKNQFGITSDLEINPSSFVFDAEVNGQYRKTFNDLVSQLPESDQALIALALTNPEDSRVTPAVKKLLESLKLEAKNQVIQNKSLPANWNPSVDLSIAISPAIQTAWNSIQYIEEALDNAFAILASYPNSPEKNGVLNIMKKIQEAMTEVKQLIYKLQELDAQLGKEMGKVESEIMAEKIKLEEEKYKQNLEKQKEIEKKQKSSKLAMQILGPILVAIAVVIAIFTAGAGSALVVAAMVAVGTFLVADSIYQAASDKPSLLAQMVKELCDKGDGGIAAAWILIAIMSIISCNPTLGTMIVATSGILGQTIKAKGGSDKAAMIADLVLGIVLAVAGGIGSAAGKGAKLGVTAGKGAIKAAEKTARTASIKAVAKGTKEATKAADDAGKVLSEAIKTTTKLTKKAAQGGLKGWNASIKLMGGKVNRFIRNKKVLDLISLTAETAQGVTQGVNSIYQGQIHLLKADLARKMGAVDAEIAELQELLKQLRKMIDQLLDGLPQHGEDLKAANDTLKGMFDSASATSDIVAQANTRG